jgi:hypothetical protein
MRFLSQLYAFMYQTQRRKFLGVALSTWIVLLLLMLALWAFMLRWPGIISKAALLFAVALVAGYWLAGRRG